ASSIPSHPRCNGGEDDVATTMGPSFPQGAMVRRREGTAACVARTWPGVGTMSLPGVPRCGRRALAYAFVACRTDVQWTGPRGDARVHRRGRVEGGGGGEGGGYWRAA
ncbi:hypothetical protein H0H92_015649, partial [Tricholoma furcatifolium]